MRCNLRAVCAVVLGILSTQAVSAVPSFEIIGQDFIDNVGIINGSIRPSIAENGEVVFTATQLPVGAQSFFVGDGVNPLSPVQYSAAGYSGAGAVKIDAAGTVAFVGTRSAVPNNFRGVYRTDTTGSSYSTVFEVEQVIGPPPIPNPQSRLAMSGNGTLAFSNIANGDGALYTAPQGGAATVLRQGSGTFFNNLPFDVNDAGAVAIQMEYTDPNNGLSRGILVFDTPGDDLASIETTIERVDVGNQPKLALSNLGQVAFVLDFTATINYLDPPLPGGGTPNGSQILSPGVYLANPSPFGTPFTFTQIADTTGLFNSFGEVRLNDNGTVVFEASVEISPGNFESGIFTGGDPIADELVLTGKTININSENNFFSVIRLGDLNNQDQLTFQTSDFLTTDQRVWRVSNVPEPASMVILMAATAACLSRRRD